MGWLITYLCVSAICRLVLQAHCYCIVSSSPTGLFIDADFAKIYFYNAESRDIEIDTIIANLNLTDI